MTFAEEIARIHNLIGRVRHLLPTIEKEGWITLDRIANELLDRIERTYAPRDDNKVPVTIYLSPKLVAAMAAIAKIKGLREVSTEEASQVFHEEFCRIYEGAKNLPSAKFGEDVAMMFIADTMVEDADEQIFEAVLLALDESEN